MAIASFQYCHLHKEMEDYPACTKVKESKPAMLPPNERPVLWTKVGADGKTEIKFPPRRESKMLPTYVDQGFQRTEFTSAMEHQKFCDANGLVNHAAEGIK